MKEKKKIIKVHSFSRVSSKRQKELGISLERQEKTNRARERRDDLKITDFWSIDETGERAIRKERKKFDRFFEVIEDETYYHIVLCEKLDRLFRNEYDKLAIRALIKEGRIEIRTDRPPDTFDSSADAFKRFVYNIMGTLAEFQSDYLRDERDKSIEMYLARGEYPGQVPVGYRNIPKTKRRPRKIVKTEMAPIVKKLLLMFNTGRYTPKEMERKARDIGLRSKRGNVLQLPAVKWMLRDRFYCGEFEWAGEVYKDRGYYEPLIPKEVWQQNIELLAMMTKKFRISKGKKWRFKGLIFCGECGRTLLGEEGRRQYYSKKLKKKITYKHIYYHCSRGLVEGKDGEKHRCKSQWFKEEEVERELINQISMLEFDEGLWKKMKKKLFEIEDKELIENEIKVLRAERTRSETKYEELYRDFKEGRIDESFLVSQGEAIRERQEEIRTRLEELEEEREIWEEKMEKVVGVIDSLKSFKEKFLEADDEAKNHMVQLMTRKILAKGYKGTVRGRKIDYKYLDIEWNEEFERLFELGLIKKSKEWDKKNMPFYQWPKKLSNQKKNVDFLCSINYL